MITSVPMRLQMHWLPQGHFLISGRHPDGTPWEDLFQLKKLLFAWHAPSAYGTFIETGTVGQLAGALLPADVALDYFCEPAYNPLVQPSWEDDSSKLIAAAPHIRLALQQQSLIPDFRLWKQGTAGWKLPYDEQLDTRQLQQWLEWLIDHYLQEHPQVAGKWKWLVDSARSDTRSDDFAEDSEKDWLVSIGWHPDEAPFQCCIRLMEPQQPQDEWSLQLVLRGNDHTMLEGDGMEPVSPELWPDDWQPFAAKVSRDLERWCSIIPWLRQGGAIRSAIQVNEAWELLSQFSEQLTRQGYAVLLPAWWERLKQLKPRLRAKVSALSVPGAANPTIAGIHQWMQFDWKIALGDTEITEAQFRELAKQKQRLVRLNGAWVQLDPALLRKIRQAMKQAQPGKGMPFREVLEAHLLGSRTDGNELGEGDDHEDAMPFEIELDQQLRHWMEQLQRLDHLPRLQPPAAFRGKLRSYQLDGATWLMFLRRFGFGGCLADDMGLGKTIQWIAYLLALKEAEPNSGPSLLICPTSVLGNWQKELARFAPEPGLRIHVHYGPGRSKEAALQQAAQAADLVITSYTLAHIDEAELTSIPWNCVCLDEAQHIKNAHTKQAAAIRKLNAVHRIAMTGTPVENRLTELWSIFDFINPGYLGSLKTFVARYVQPIERTGDAQLIERIQRLTRPFLLRREKNDPAVELDLPGKIESKLYVPLTTEQAALYEQFVNDLFTRMEQATPFQRKGLILSSLTRLKQLCDHPALFLKEDDPDRVLLRSHKAERLLDMVKELRQQGDRCLIFTQFIDMGKLLQNTLDAELGERPLFLYGGTAKEQRDEMIARFQQGEADRDGVSGIFILSLKAGGTGLNLTAANHVFHFDRWWNPAVENQATDRTHRIGQNKHVHVHKLITLGTLEERIDEMIERKTSLSQQIIGAGEQWITEMSSDQLRDLFLLRRDWLDH